MEALKLEKRKYTVEEYFELVEKSQHKLEYLDGTIRVLNADPEMMAGGSASHSEIVDNAFFLLRSNQGNCTVRSSELAVSVASQDKYYFPDVSAVCGEDLKYEEGKGIARITNPCLIVEVLSSSTSDQDRGEKFQAYRRLPSFREYILIDSRKHWVETFYREANDLWHIRSYFKTDQVVEIKTLGVDIPLSKFYEGIHFSEEAD